MTDAQPIMTAAEIAAEIAAHEATLEALRKLQRARAPASPSGDLVTIAVCEAAWLSGMSESQVRRDCAANPYNDHTGFGIRIGGRWRVAKDRYLDARLRA
jgi:hypothetical protein